MKTYVESFFRINGEFVPVEHYTGALPDIDYIEGAIECRIGGQSLLGKENWDLVDQLWSYILQGLSALHKGEEYESCFPDQPLLLRFRIVSERSVEITVGESGSCVDRRVLVSTLAAGAITFFTSMLRIAPSLSESWSQDLSQARSLVKGEL